MLFKLFDYVNAHGKNEFKEWTAGLQKPMQARLIAKIDMLEQQGPGLFPQILTGTDVPGILKLRVKGNVQLRPMLCRGPIDIDSEFTLLFGATEKGDVLVPVDAPKIASAKKHEVIADPASRRKDHERVLPKTR